MKKIVLAASMIIGVFTLQAQTRVPLFEVFTSSTCPPCNPGNKVYEAVVKDKPKGDYVSIKFQQDFPGDGDPYCSAEAVSRRSYYAINSIPRMEIDGAWDQNASNFTDGLYTSAKSIAPKYAISGTFEVNNKVVTANIKYAPLTTITTSHKLYVAIVEKHTANNIETNGETVFYNVMKKMMPNHAGTTLGTFNVGDQDSISLTFTFQGNYRLPVDGQASSHIKDIIENSVEYFENLKVVAWIQGSDKEVYNAVNLTDLAPKMDPNPLPTAVGKIPTSVSAVSIYPNPVSSTLNVNVNMSKSDVVTASLLSLSGTVIATKTTSFAQGQQQLSFDAQNLPNGAYSLIVWDSHKNSFSQNVTVVH